MTHGNNGSIRDTKFSHLFMYNAMKDTFCMIERIQDIDITNYFCRCVSREKT